MNHSPQTNIDLKLVPNLGINRIGKFIFRSLCHNTIHKYTNQWWSQGSASPDPQTRLCRAGGASSRLRVQVAPHSLCQRLSRPYSESARLLTRRYVQHLSLCVAVSPPASIRGHCSTFFRVLQTHIPFKYLTMNLQKYSFLWDKYFLQFS